LDEVRDKPVDPPSFLKNNDCIMIEVAVPELLVQLYVLQGRGRDLSYS